MTYGKKNLLRMLLACIFYLVQSSLFAQVDTTHKPSDKDRQTKSRLFKKMMKNFTRDTTAVQKANDLKRNDALYKKFEGYIIRRITIRDLYFGIPLEDTSKRVVTTLTKLANKFIIPPAHPL